jgi:hypothetical protein
MVIRPARISAMVKMRALAAKLMPTSGLGGDAMVVERIPRETIMIAIRIHRDRMASPADGRLPMLVLTVTSPNGFSPG